MESLIRYHWPGNIRELQNCVERAVIASPEPTLQFSFGETRRWGRRDTPSSIRTLADIEREHIEEDAAAGRWRIRRTSWRRSHARIATDYSAGSHAPARSLFESPFVGLGARKLTRGPRKNNFTLGSAPRCAPTSMRRSPIRAARLQSQHLLHDSDPRPWSLDSRRSLVRGRDVARTSVCGAEVDLGVPLRTLQIPKAKVLAPRRMLRSHSCAPKEHNLVRCVRCRSRLRHHYSRTPARTRATAGGPGDMESVLRFALPGRHVSIALDQCVYRHLEQAPQFIAFARTQRLAV